MKLIGYELNKIVHKRIVMLLAIILLLINSVFFVNEQRKDHHLLIQNRDQYKQVEQSYKGLPPVDGKRLTTLQVQQFILYGQFIQAYLSPKDSPWQKIVADLKRDNQQAYEQYETSPYFNQEQAIIRDSYLLNMLRLQFENADHFDDKISSMEEQANEMKSVSIFNKKDSFSYRNIVKTVEDFKPLRGLPFQLGLEEGIVSGTNTWSTDFCLAMLIFLLITILFYVEKEEGLTSLIRSTRHGKLRTFGAKLTALTLITIFLSLIYYGSILLLAERLYGFGSLSRYIQSMSSFYHAVQPLTVEQYLLVYMLLKILVNILLGWLMAALFLGLGHISKIYVATSLLLGASYLCYSLIHPNSYLNVLKYINILAFYDAFHFISDYRNLNILGYPVRKDTLTLWVWAIMTAILPLACAWLFVKQPVSITSPAPLRWIVKWKASLWKHRRMNSLFLHEWYKLLIVGKSVLVLIFAVILMYNRIDQNERPFDLDSGTYNRYILSLHGELTQEKLLFLSEERDKFTAMPQELDALKLKLKNKEIDLITYNQEKFKIDEYAKQDKAFRFVEKQRDYLLQLKQKQGITGNFVNTISSDALFNNQQDHLLDGIIYVFLLIVGLGPLFALDYKNEMMRVIWSSPRGRWRLFAMKHAIAYAFAIWLLVLVQIPKFYNVIVHYPRLDWSAPVQSIEVLGNVNWPISILTYVIVTSLLQLLGVLMLAHVILFIALSLKKQSFLLLTATSLAVLPLCLQYMGLSVIDKYSFNFAFELYGKFNSVSYGTGISLYFGGLVVVGMAAFRAAWSIINRFKWREN